MFLFPNTKNRAIRIGKNLVVYGIGGIAVCMFLSLLLPQVVAEYVYLFSALCSSLCIGGCLTILISAIIRGFRLKKSPPAAPTPQPKQDYHDTLLLDEGNCYEGTQIVLRFFNNGKLAVIITGWWPRSGGQVTLPLDADYFSKYSIDDFILWLTQQCHKDFSRLKERRDVLDLFDSAPPLPQLDIKVGECYHAGSTEQYLSLRKDATGYYIHEYAWDYNAHKETSMSNVPLSLSSYAALIAQLKEWYPTYEIDRYITDNPRLWQVFLDDAIVAMTAFLQEHHYDVKTHLGKLSVVKHSDDPYNHFCEFIAKSDGVYNYIEVAMGTYRLTKRLSCDSLTIASFILLAEIVKEADPNHQAEDVWQHIRPHVHYALQHTTNHDKGQWIIDSLSPLATPAANG